MPDHNFTYMHCSTSTASTAQLLPPNCYTMPSVISPFFVAGSPPPPSPIPTCQANLADFARPVVLIAHTTLFPRVTARRNGIVHVAAPPNPRRSSSHAGRAPPASIGQGQFIPGPMIAIQKTASACDTDSDLTSISGSSSDRSSPTPTPAPAPAPSRIVCKPRGEVGRPGRGGYSLKNAVDFKESTLRTIQVCRASPSPSHTFNLVSLRNMFSSCVTSILIPARVSKLKMRTESGKYATR